MSDPINEAVDRYLVGLRNSGVVNMFDASPLLQSEFSLDKTQARAHLARWMEAFVKDPSNKIKSKIKSDNA